MRRSRHFPVVVLFLSAALTFPATSASGATVPVVERAVEQPQIPPEEPPWSGCIYSMDLNPYWRGHCDGYRQGVKDAQRAGRSCSRWGPPEFWPRNTYERGYATGYKVAYRYYFRVFLSRYACELRSGQEPPGPITR